MTEHKTTAENKKDIKNNCDIVKISENKQKQVDIGKDATVQREILQN